MKINQFFFVFMAIFVLNVSVSAQYTSLPYVCDFESKTECDNWKLNVGNTSKFVNKWTIGKPYVAMDDDEGNFMYISFDNGSNVGYEDKDNFVISYRSFSLLAGNYDLAFDWKGLGAEDMAEMYVAWVPEAYELVYGQNVSLNFYTGKGDWPTWFKVTMVKNINGTDSVLFGRTSWTHSTAKLYCPENGNYRLVFVWVNKNSEPNSPGGCVDNIELGRAACGLPSDLVAIGNGKVATFTWSGSAPEYEMKYLKEGDSIWTEIKDINTNQISINNIPNGIYEVKLRAICGSDTTIWAYFPLTFVYEAQCVDYLKLDKAFCTYGEFKNPAKNIGKRDFGYDSDLSCHTIHYKSGETDPRTGGMLKTTPDGAVASVRLGNWDTGSKAESITYDYTVDVKTASIMLLKYAMVLEDPDHDVSQQPRFTLEILDENGEMIDDLCGAADFRASSDTSVWNTYYPKGTSGTSSLPIRWRDWTTVGLNLEAYDGRTLKIRLTTYDCNQGGHFGYAYFTIGCTVGTLEGMNCGDYPTNEFIAPEGFLYRWYTETDTKTIWTERIMSVDPSDETHYLVDVIYPTEARCYFTLKACAIPRFPFAEMTYTHTPKDCQNYVTFNNTSGIVTKEGITGDKVDAVYWNFGNGMTSMEFNPVLAVPDEGYHYDSCYLVASLCSDLCTDTLWFTLDVPAIGHVSYAYDTYKCENDTLFIEGDTILTEGSYIFLYTSNFSGCDSTVIVNVIDHPIYNVEVNDTIILGEEYVFGTQVLDHRGEFVETFKSSNGCDSIVTLRLHVLQLLDFEMSDSIMVCHDDPIIPLQFELVKGDPISVNITFDEQAKKAKFVDIQTLYEGTNLIEIPMPDSVLPGVYTCLFELSDGVIGYDSITLTLDVRYGTSVLTQRWDDVIGVKNSEYNGGFDFSAFQWFENDNAISGANLSILYLDKGLDLDAEYTVLLTRVSDGVSQYTCGFLPEYYDKSNEVLTVYNVGQVYEYATEQPALVRIWSILGELQGSYDIGTEGSVPMPTTPGIYIMEIIMPDLQKSYKIVVK